MYGKFLKVFSFKYKTWSLAYEIVHNCTSYVWLFPLDHYKT